MTERFPAKRKMKASANISNKHNCMRCRRADDSARSGCTLLLQSYNNSHVRNLVPHVSFAAALTTIHSLAF
jgi:hypothetical protein